MRSRAKHSVKVALMQPTLEAVLLTLHKRTVVKHARTRTYNSTIHLNSRHDDIASPFFPQKFIDEFVHVNHFKFCKNKRACLLTRASEIPPPWQI